MAANPMLAVTIYEAYAGDGARDSSAVVLHAAVHAWYEGHIAGEGSGAPIRADPDDEMPAPPFPGRTNMTLQGILDQTAELFAADELAPAAAAHAASLAFAAGFAEGKSCPGCSFRGENPELAEAVRSGNQPLCLFRGSVGGGIPTFPPLLVEMPSDSAGGSWPHT